jgi:hypothetical protein
MTPYRFRNFVADILIFAVLACVSDIAALLWLVWIVIRSYQRYKKK